MEPEAARIGVMLAVARELARVEMTPDNLDRAIEGLVELAREARAVDPHFAVSHPQVPWIILAAAGDIVLRAGEDVDAAEIWATVARDLPELQARLAQAE